MQHSKYLNMHRDGSHAFSLVQSQISEQGIQSPTVTVKAANFSRPKMGQDCGKFASENTNFATKARSQSQQHQHIKYRFDESK